MGIWFVSTCSLLGIVINRIIYYEYLHTSFLGHVFSFLECISRSGTAKTYGNSVFHF